MSLSVLRKNLKVVRSLLERAQVRLSLEASPREHIDRALAGVARAMDGLPFEHKLGCGLYGVEVGDEVFRWIGDIVSHKLIVTKVEDGYIHCGPWAFCQRTGDEVDGELDWNDFSYGSVIKLYEKKEKAGSEIDKSKQNGAGSEETRKGKQD